MKQPEGFIAEGEQHLVCKLTKSIYGLKQSPRGWNLALDTCLKELNFEPTISDPCIYVSTGDEPFYFGVNVDDIILAGPSNEKIQEVKNASSAKFDIKDMGKLHFFIGMTIDQKEN